MQETIDGLQEVRELAAQFAAERLRPNVERWDHARRIDDAAAASLAELGFHGMLVPETSGGLGFGLPTFVAVLEEIAWGEPVVAYSLLASAALSTTLRESDDREPAAWLEALATGARTAAMSLAPAAARATRRGDGWMLEGRAGWVLRHGEADLLLLEVAAPADGRRQRFVLPATAPGVTTTERQTTLGLLAARIHTLELRSVALQSSAATSESDAAVDVVERLGSAAIANGIARAALEHARDYADVREQFGRKLRGFEGIRTKLADMDTRLAASRALLAAAATEPAGVAAARARLFASETATWVSNQAVQIFGGYGYMRDYPVEKLMRDAKSTEILTETNETLRGTIAAGLYPQ